jgi:hypothetical protein
MWGYFKDMLDQYTLITISTSNDALCKNIFTHQYLLIKVGDVCTGGMDAIIIYNLPNFHILETHNFLPLGNWRKITKHSKVHPDLNGLRHSWHCNNN